MQPHTRRRFLTAATAGVVAAASGCLGTSVPANELAPTAGLDAQSSFFVAGDIARQVAGDVATVGDLVPVGQHGHGWHPGPRVLQSVVDSDLYVYVDEGFQPWADDIVATLRTDAPDVSVVAVGENVDRLPAPGADGHAGDEAGEHGGTHETNEDGAEDHDGTESDHAGSENTHDHGTVDPHFWLDPQRTKPAVESVREALVETDPTNRAAYDANAESFAAALDALDAEFEARLEDRTRDAVLVAGHDAFQYLGHRYDFEVYALAGIAPDAVPTPRAVRRAQDIVDEHDIEYVLAPVFESSRAATQLVEETGATALLPVTALPTLSPAWDDRGWGYLDVMREVNLASVATALGAE